MTGRTERISILATGGNGRQHELYVFNRYQTFPGSGPPVEALMSGEIRTVCG
jgi:hypothetical protein